MHPSTAPKLPPPSYPTPEPKRRGHSRSRPVGLAPHVPGQHQQPSCFPPLPGRGSEAHEGLGSTTLENPFLFQSGVRAFAGQTQCPGGQAWGKPPDVPSVPQVALALHQGCEISPTQRPSSATLPCSGWGQELIWAPRLAPILGLEVRHRGLQLRQSHGRSVGSRGWHQGVQWLLF